MKIQTILSCLLLFAAPAAAQKISAGKIEETRSNEEGYFSNRCKVELKITGDEIRKYKFVRVNTLNKAMDDQGIDMIDEDELDFDYKEVEDNIVGLELNLNTSSRKATVIRELAGEVVLFNPTEANGGVIKVASFQNKPNTNLLPAKAPFKLLFLDKKALEEFHAANKDKSEAELKKLPAATRAVAQILLQAFESLSFMEDNPNQLTLLADGDASKLVKIQFEDAAGQVVESNGSMTMGENLFTYYFNDKPDPKWRMTIFIEAAGALKKLPFTLKDIELP